MEFNTQLFEKQQFVYPSPFGGWATEKQIGSYNLVYAATILKLSSLLWLLDNLTNSIFYKRLCDDF